MFNVRIIRLSVFTTLRVHIAALSSGIVTEGTGDATGTHKRGNLKDKAEPYNYNTVTLIIPNYGIVILLS